jgi:hypothetical protein
MCFWRKRIINKESDMAAGAGKEGIGNMNRPKKNGMLNYIQLLELLENFCN